MTRNPDFGGPGARALLLVVATVLLVVYPPLYTYWHAGVRGIFSFVSGDSFLYLTIAERSAGRFFTFDGSTPTNGFHPLWQVVLTALLGGQEQTQTGTARPLLITFAVSTGLVAAGTTLTALAIHRYTRSVVMGLLTIPGAYFLLIGSVFRNNSIWEQIGGMESGLSVLFGGLTFFIISVHVTRPNVTWDDLFDRTGFRSLFLQLGLVLPLLFLSRLDDIFLLGTLSLLVLLQPRPLRDRIRAIAKLTGPGWSCLACTSFTTS